MIGLKNRKEIDWQKAFASRKELILSDSFANSAISTENQQERIAKAKKSYAYFVKTYFPRLASAPSADFHVKAANEILDNKRLRAVYEWARGLAKSTNMSLMIPLWLFLAHAEK
ncbi:MAG: hypothetical protein U0L38_06595, partial [Bacteroidales bacterium]|nr:hypothetical protein [Bacteroidales bacterium]